MVDAAPVARWRWPLVAAYMAFIFALSSVTMPPALPGGTDKDLHALLYGGLAVVLIRALAGGLRRRVSLNIAILAVVVAALYGVSDEFHQSFVPSRDPDVWDVVADAIGAAVSAGVLYSWSLWSRRRT